MKPPLAHSRQVEEQLLKHMSAEYRRDAHHWLILHGRYTWIARAPSCNDCLIADICEFPGGKRPEQTAAG